MALKKFSILLMQQINYIIYVFISHYYVAFLSSLQIVYSSNKINLCGDPMVTLFFMIYVRCISKQLRCVFLLDILAHLCLELYFALFNTVGSNQYKNNVYIQIHLTSLRFCLFNH